MNGSTISKKIIMLSFLVSTSILVLSYCSSYIDNRTKIVFCNVGQGDGAYLRIKNKVDVMIDTGPDKKILNCLGKYMPFYDHTIEIIFITHPQKDHMNGLNLILDSYKVNNILINKLTNRSKFFDSFTEKIKTKNTKLHFPTQGYNIKIFNDSFNLIWPTKKFIDDNITYDTKNQQFGYSASDPNDFSFVTAFSEGEIQVLYTGDISPLSLSRIIDESLYQPRNRLSILKIPHHGSKNGLIPEFLELANPVLSVISVGKDNSYGHPAAELLSMLESHKKKYLRTDEEGDIVFYIENGRLIRDQ